MLASVNLKGTKSQLTSLSLFGVPDETEEEYQERKREEFAQWLEWTKSASYKFEVL